MPLPAVGPSAACRWRPLAPVGVAGHIGRQHFQRNVAALSHPNILAIHDIGTDDNTLFVVTELLDGETLADRARTRRRARQEHRAS